MSMFDPYREYPPEGPLPQPAPVRRPGTLLPLAISAIFGALIALGLYRWVFNRGTPAVDPRPVTPAGELAADERGTIDLFQEVSPSVVFITTVTQRLDLWTRNLQEIPQGTGSGFIWDDAGHVVTNFHVVKDATGAQITLSDHGTYPADLVGYAPDFDLAVLKIKAPRDKLRPVARIGSSHDLKVGQKVFAVGNPFGLDQTLTTGIVSALGRTIRAVTNQPIEDAIQTDAAINPGNSGGPLFDSSRRLIGVNTAIYSPSGASAGIGFAVPVDTVDRVVPQLIAQGRVTAPNLGIIVDDRLGLPITRKMEVEGVLVLGVRPGSPAEQAGIRPTQRRREGYVPGDVIQTIDGRRVTNAAEYNGALFRLKPGGTAALGILREGQPVMVQVQVPGRLE